jgi:hypothetical protein
MILSTGSPLGADGFVSNTETVTGKRLVKINSGLTTGKSRIKKLFLMSPDL